MMRYKRDMQRVKESAEKLLKSSDVAMVNASIRDAEDDEATDFARAVLSVCEEFGV